jgi:hypothetical protein
LGQRPEICTPISIGGKYVLAVVAALNDVMRVTDNDNSEFACHARVRAEFILPSSYVALVQVLSRDSTAKN